MKPSFGMRILLGICALLIGFVSPARAATSVPCDVTALINAISSASSGDTLDLATGCTYTLSTFIPSSGTGLPFIDNMTLTINGNGATVERSSVGGTPPFSLIGVGSNGNLTLNDLTLSNGYADHGAGLYNFGTLTVNNSTFSENKTSGNEAGAISSLVGTVTVNNSIFSGNSASVGGGIDSEFSSLTVTNSTFSGNSANCNGNSASVGGGAINISGGSATVSGSTFSGNSANCDASNGGGIRVIDATLDVSGSTFSDNSAQNGGGGIYNSDSTVTVNNSDFLGNHVTDGSGGGVLSSGVDSSLLLTNVTIANNVAASGGGISADSMSLSDCTVANNQATVDSGGGIRGSGNVSNCTIVGNSALRFGGGINVVDLTVTNTTITENSAGICGGGVYIPLLSLTLGGSDIISGNTAPDGPDICGGGVINTLGYNVVGDTSGDNNFTPAPTDLTDAAASPLNLGALADNGGFTQTMALGAGSIALGAGNCSTLAGVTPVTADQRGVARKSPCDVGAYEVGGKVPEASSGAPVSDLCEDVTTLSDSAITISGGFQNVVFNGEYGNTYCRLIAKDSHFVTSPAEIGVESVLNLGVVDAVDVFGELADGTPVVPFVTPLTVCLRGVGDVLFLSAAGVGRTPQHLMATSSGGYLCVSVPNSGTVVLVGTASNIPEHPMTPNESSPTALTNCQITTTDAPLNLRAEPKTSASVIAQLPYNLTLTATEYSPGWYQVIYLDGQGWISMDYVSTVGDCGR